LSERDEKEFAPLIQMDLKEQTGAGFVHYGTLNKLVEKVVNENGDLRDLSGNCLSREDQRGSNPPLRTARSLLFLDEVDQYFGENFYGKTYEPVKNYTSEETQDHASHLGEPLWYQSERPQAAASLPQLDRKVPF
jgi:hypothetical protein